MRLKLDQIDRHILSELQAEGRITNVELAKRVGISAPPCLRRVRALEETGVITGSCALIEEKKVGYDLVAFAMVGLSSQSEADLIAFEELVRTWPTVRECHMLSGEFDFVLRCVAPDLPRFQDFVIHQLTAAPHVANVKTSLAIRRSKYEPGVPVIEPVEGRD